MNKQQAGSGTSLCTPYHWTCTVKAVPGELASWQGIRALQILQGPLRMWLLFWEVWTGPGALVGVGPGMGVRGQGGWPRALPEQRLQALVQTIQQLVLQGYNMTSRPTQTNPDGWLSRRTWYAVHSAV